MIDIPLEGIMLNVKTRVGTQGHRDTGYHSWIDITPHTTQNQEGTPQKKMSSDVHTGVGTPHRNQTDEGHRTK